MFILLGNKHELEASGRSELQEVGELGGGNVPEGQPSL